MKTFLNTTHDIFFNSKLNDFLGFTNKRYAAGRNLSEKIANIPNVDKVQLKCNCVDDSILDGKRESIPFSFSLNVRPVYKSFKDPSSILFIKVNNGKVDDITFYLEDEDGKEVKFNGEILTFTVVLTKI